MKKQILSVVLCLSMLLSIFAINLTVNATTVNKNESKASTTDKKTGVSKITSANDFTWDNANVYFLLTDRFKNGNTSNDHSYGRATDKDGSPLSGWDTAPGTFHGGDFAGVTQEIEDGYFDNLGVNAIWISAPYEQIHGYVDSGKGFAHYSYHGYYVLDYTETDANFGTKEEFQTLVDTAHKHGIRVVLDIVMNHSGYNSVADMEEFHFGTLLPGASDFKYKLDNVSDVNSNIDYETSASDWGKWWGNDWIRSGLPGYTGGQGGSDLTRSLEGLPDFRTEQTKTVSIPPILKTKWTQEGTYDQKVAKYGDNSGSVSDYLTTWLSEWVSQYGVDGFRCDTAKHVEMASWKKLKDKCVSALKTWRENNPTKAGADWDEDFWMTGECWDHNIGSGYDSYFTEGGFDSMINFDTSGSPLPAASSINGKFQHYADSINSNDKFNQLTYISSHDSNLARTSDMAYQGSALMLLPGAVQVFYGDETNRKTVPGMSFDGHGGSGHSLRSDMNWDSIDQDELAHWQKVGTFRKNHVAVGAGQHQQITAYNGSTGYTFARTYDDGNVSDNIIATIGAPNNKDIPVDVSSLWSDGTEVTNAYDGTKAVVTDGTATFNSGEHGTILIEGPTSTINMSLKGASSFYGSEEVTVSLKGADYAMVSINGGEEFKVVDGQKFTIGEDIPVGTTFKVKMTATNSEETASKSFSFKKKDPDAITRVYFDPSLNWGSTIYAYIYNESGSSVVENEKWPGQKMTLDPSTGLYLIEVSEELRDGQVIFTGGSNRYPDASQPGLKINSTDMIFTTGNQWKAYTGQKPSATIPTTPDPSSNVTVYYENTNNYATPYIYYWKKSSDSSSVQWPGVAMTKYKDNIWCASLPKDNDMCIFNNNGGSQTGNLSIPGDGYLYSNGKWSSSPYVVPTTATTTTKPTTATTATTATKPTTATTATTATTPTELLGDVNGDGVVSVKDATLIQKYVSEMTVTINVKLADVNKDGQISIKDTTMIQKYAAEKIDKLG